jgi:hypothetical protein
MVSSYFLMLTTVFPWMVVIELFWVNRWLDDSSHLHQQSNHVWLITCQSQPASFIYQLNMAKGAFGTQSLQSCKRFGLSIMEWQAMLLDQRLLLIKLCLSCVTKSKSGVDITFVMRQRYCQKCSWLSSLRLTIFMTKHIWLSVVRSNRQVAGSTSRWSNRLVVGSTSKVIQQAGGGLYFKVIQ